MVEIGVREEIKCKEEMFFNILKVSPFSYLTTVFPIK
jgi:hypothetical protein